MRKCIRDHVPFRPAIMRACVNTIATHGWLFGPLGVLRASPNSGVGAHMKRLPQRVGFAVLASLSCSCNLIDSGTNWRSGRFQVEWMDTAPSSRLAYRLQSGDSIEIVEACVFAAGADKRHVVVGQRPLQQPAVSHYYVLSIEGFNPLHPRQRLRGPLGASAYDALAKQLSLPSIRRVVPRSTCSASAR